MLQSQQDTLNASLDLHICRLSSSDPVWVVEFARIAAMVTQVKGAKDLPDPHHVSLGNLLKGPRILII